MGIDHPAERFIQNLLNDEDAKTASSEEAFADESSDETVGKPVTPNNLFTHHDTHPVILDTALLKLFGVQWFEWEPETLWAELSRQYIPSGAKPSELTRNKINAVKTLHMNMLPWENWEVFIPVALAINNVIPIFEVMHELSLAQMMAGVNTINRIRMEEFDPEVRRYMAACFLDQGVVYAPPPIDFIQPEISQPSYRCLDCGNEDQDDLVDGVCDVCSERFTDARPLNFKPNEELAPRIAQGEGRRLVKFLKFPFEDVNARYDQVQNIPLDDLTLGRNRVDIQVMKLMVARNYLQVREAQLADQVRTLQAWLGGA